MNPAVAPELVAELLALQPYVEHILCDGSREPHLRAAAKDRVQTVLRKALQHLPSYQPHKEGLRPWLTRITRNERVDGLRSSQRHDDIFGPDQVTVDIAPDTCPSPEREAQVRALLEKVFEIIEEMQPEVQDVLVLSAFCDDSHAEIAAHLGITENAVKMRLLRARQMLRKRVGTIRDHVGLWLLVLIRSLNVSRLFVPRFLWPASHLLPPLLIWFVAMPQFEPPLTSPAENVGFVASTTMSVPDNQVAVEVVKCNRSGAVSPTDAISPPKQRPAKPRPMDKPRQRPQTNRNFDVDVAPAAIFMNDRR
jgi:RNA polymerase sigma factor (sigma-70 family)